MEELKKTGEVEKITQSTPDCCALEVQEAEGRRVLKIGGRLDAKGASAIWDQAVKALPESQDGIVDVSEVSYLDGAGIGLLLDLQRRANRQLEIRGLRREFERLLLPFRDVRIPTTFGHRQKKLSTVVQMGEIADGIVHDLQEMVQFTGRLALLLGDVFRRADLVRWKDVWLVFEKAGSNAFLIVGLIGFLMGVIMAFQSTIPLRQFGVDLFVVNLVALAVLRELGPVMTAVILAGRSGSAFAAEIGTMKVNEEVNALITMGMDPGRFLVLPRVLAGVIATPLLTIYADFIGVMGGLLVVASFGHSWPTIINQLTSAISFGDIFTGLVKSVVFGLLVSGIGCLRGLQTKNGALAVGESTTRAVVSGIFLIVLFDAIFAALFYALNI